MKTPETRSKETFEWPKASLTIAIPGPMFEHLQSCRSSTLGECIQHLGLDGSRMEHDRRVGIARRSDRGAPSGPDEAADTPCTEASSKV